MCVFLCENTEFHHDNFMEKFGNSLVQISLDGDEPILACIVQTGAGGIRYWDNPKSRDNKTFNGKSVRIVQAFPKEVGYIDEGDRAIFLSIRGQRQFRQGFCANRVHGDGWNGEIWSGQQLYNKDYKSIGDALRSMVLQNKLSAALSCNFAIARDSSVWYRESNVGSISPRGDFIPTEQTCQDELTELWNNEVKYA